MRNVPLKAIVTTRRNIGDRMANLPLLQGSQTIIKIVLGGTFFAVSMLLVLLCISYFVSGNTYVGGRIIAAIGILLYLVIIAALVRRQRFKTAAALLIIFYGLVASVVLAVWGVNAPVGILTLGFVIILAATMLGARYIIPVTIGIVILLIGLQSADMVGLTEPDRSLLSKPSTIVDVASYGVIFIIFALVSWLSRSQTEQALRHAYIAEKALLKEKKLLAVRLDEQTRRLRESQLVEMNQLYRFAELGQLSTATMHELANHLTVLALDIDDMDDRSVGRSQAIDHARESMTYLDTMVARVRSRLQETNESRPFNVGDVIDDTIESVKNDAVKANVVIDLQLTSIKSLPVMGDPLRLAQVIRIITNNAIESYRSVSGHHNSRSVLVITEKTPAAVKIIIEDRGIGMTPQVRSRLFEPFHSTKKGGMGVGLYIAKKMIETHFKGTITLDPTPKVTRFVIELPLYTPRK